MDIVETIERAFGNVERPPNEAFIHPESIDYGDIEPLFEFGSWRDMSDDEVEGLYASLSFMSAEAFRYFIPAYLLYCVRNPESPAAVIDSTVWSFLPELFEENLHPYIKSRWVLFDDAQRDAIAAFLEFMVPHQPDAARALENWNK